MNRSEFTIFLKRIPHQKPPTSLGVVDHLIASIPSPCQTHRDFPTGNIATKLIFSSRSDAIAALCFFWQLRLDGAHSLFPYMDLGPEPIFWVKKLLVAHLEFVLGGEFTNKLENRVSDVEKEIEVQKEMTEEKERLEVELEQIKGRVEEFRGSMERVLRFLKEGKVDKVGLVDGEVVALKLAEDWDLKNFLRVHCSVMRECRRVSDGLAIYASRSKILKTMFKNKVAVVIGETGSGKSTQLVQFIADSGLAASGSIVCTQPRKIVATSVAQRVREESSGCYNDNFVDFCHMYPSTPGFKSRMIFMTDNCQHYLPEKNFGGISYIIVDEAHERSLNTDGLLAVLKKELLQRHGLKVILMSATADAQKLAEYFNSCPTIFVKGRTFPVSIQYVHLESQKMTMNVIPVTSTAVLRSFCGRLNSNIHSIVSLIREQCMDDRISLDVEFATSDVRILAAAKDMEKVSSIVTNYLEYENKWLKNECLERSLFDGGPEDSFALFGSGAEIKHLELENRFLTVEIIHPLASEINEKVLLHLVEQQVPGIAGYFKTAGTGLGNNVADKWGTITFLNPQSAITAVSLLNKLEIRGSSLKVLPMTRARDPQLLSSFAIRARVCWPRWQSMGAALIRCAEEDLDAIICDSTAVILGGVIVKCVLAKNPSDGLFVSGIPDYLSESEIFSEFARCTTTKILGVQLFKKEAVDSAPIASCAEVLRSEIEQFMPNNKCAYKDFQVEVFEPKPTDQFVRATLAFNGSLHLEAAKALDYLQGKVLAGCLPWQNVHCEPVIHSSVFFSRQLYDVIKKDLDSLLGSFNHINGVNYKWDKYSDGSCCIRISANDAKIVADLRMSIEKLTKGQILIHPSLTSCVLHSLLTHDGMELCRSVEKKTGTYILYDSQNLNLKLFGPPSSVTKAEEKLVKSLLLYHDQKPVEFRLRGFNLPKDLMKELVKRFGADLNGLKKKFKDGVEVSLNTRHHILTVRGSKEQKQKIEEIVFSDVAQSPRRMFTFGMPSSQPPECPICLCELDEPYKLVGCGHDFCHGCLVEQCESAARSHDGFPICCAKAGCNQPLLLVDFKSILTRDKLEELFRASLGAFVFSSGGRYRFCPSVDCPGIYQVSDKGHPFVCGACSAETCTRCHAEYHPFIPCDMYNQLKDRSDKSLIEWREGKEYVKDCPSCHHTIEKDEGCHHVECRCGKHICWECFKWFESSEKCYSHLWAVNFHF